MPASATAPYARDPPPSPSGYSCPTGTQFPVPFPYGYGQQVQHACPTTKGHHQGTPVVVKGALLAAMRCCLLLVACTLLIMSARVRLPQSLQC